VQIFRGLAYIHSVPGVCHRDIKPQNILVCWFYPRHVSVPDFLLVMFEWKIANLRLFLSYDRWILFPTKSRFVTLGVLKSWYVHAPLIGARNIIFFYLRFCIKLNVIKHHKLPRHKSRKFTIFCAVL